MYFNKEQLIRDFDYDAKTGSLTWAKGARRGKRAGCVDKRGYVYVGYQGKLVGAHRLIWQREHGNLLSTQVIDHINHNKTDNRLCNLRAVSASVNLINRRGPQANSTTGIRNVRTMTLNGTKYWRIELHRDGKCVYNRCIRYESMSPEQVAQLATEARNTHFGDVI